ncbi:hypothetical protein KCU71_g2731, partial [Aureobasidium melanogenum]
MAVGPWKKKEEQPKTAMYTGWVSVLTGLLVHIVPLAACITLIYLNASSCFIGTRVSTLAFQFLAKLLELLAQASLGSAVFVYLRALYTGSESVPFGALFAGLQITKVSYLWSLEFAGVVTSTSFRRTRKFVFLLLIPLSIVLALGIGPSIAIALAPTLGDFHNGWIKAWINATEHQIFPSTMDSTTLVYNFSDNCSTGDCAKYSWETAINIARSSQQSQDQESVTHQGSLALTQDALPYRELRWSAISGGSPLFVTVTVPSKVVAWSLVRLAEWSYAHNPTMLLSEATHNFTTTSRQPTVTANCTQANWLNSTSIHTEIYDDQIKVHEYVFQSDSLRSLNETESLNWVFLDRDFDRDQGPSELEPSVWVFIRYPPGNRSPYLGPLGLCAIYADYAYVKYTISVDPDAEIYENKLVSSQMISPSNTTTNISAMWFNRTLPDLSALLSGGLEEVDTATFLATSLAISMAQWPKQTLNYPNDPPTPLGRTGGWPDPGVLVGGPVTSTRWLGSSAKDHVLFPGSEQAEAQGKYRLRMDVSSHGYGYSIDQPTKVIAIAVLAAYSLYILFFVVLMLTLNRVHSNAWDSIGELTALAIMSTPDDRLRNTSAGIETVALFKLPMNIRANDNNHLEIVFKDDERALGSGIVEKDKKYN